MSSENANSNTVEAKTSKSKQAAPQQIFNFCFTVYNLGSFHEPDGSINPRYKALEDLVKNDICSFVIGAYEKCPETNKEHMQGFLVLTKKNRKPYVIQRLTEVLAPWGTVPVGSPLHPHVDECRGTARDNYNYCAGMCDKKGNKLNPHRVEFGEKPVFANAGEREAERWASALRLAQDGDMEGMSSSFPDIYMRYYGVIRRIAADNVDPMKIGELDKMPGLIFIGLPGAGKSFLTRALYPNAYCKPCNKWCDGLWEKEKSWIIDDLDPSHAQVLAYHLKIWTDRYPFQAEVKTSAVVCRPTRVCITTQFTPAQLWPDAETRFAMLRRCVVVKLSFAEETGMVEFHIDRRSGRGHWNFVPTGTVDDWEDGTGRSVWAPMDDQDWSFLIEEPKVVKDKHFKINYQMPTFIAEEIERRKRVKFLEAPPTLAEPVGDDFKEAMQLQGEPVRLVRQIAVRPPTPMPSQEEAEGDADCRMHALTIVDLTDEPAEILDRTQTL